MAKINYSNNIRGRGRNLHLQTNTFEETQEIVTTLFDGGRVLAKETIPYKEEAGSENLSERVEQIHREIQENIELLYAISTRVKTVRHASSLYILGLQFLRWNLIDEAIAEFELALEYDPRYGDIFLDLARAYDKRGGLKESLDVIDKGLKVVPAYADLWCLKGFVLQKMGGGNPAYQAYQEALKINPSFDEAHARAALCIIIDVIKANQEMPAEETRKRLKEHLNRAVLSKRVQDLMFEEVIRAIHQNQFIIAKEKLETVLDNLSPVVDLRFHDAFYLNFMYGETGRDSEKIHYYVKQLENLSDSHPNFPDLHNKLGIGYLIECRDLFNKALRQFQAAVNLNPDYLRAKKNLKLAQNDGKGFLILLRAMLK